LQKAVLKIVGSHYLKFLAGDMLPKCRTQTDIELQEVLPMQSKMCFSVSLVLLMQQIKLTTIHSRNTELYTMQLIMSNTNNLAFRIQMCILLCNKKNY